MALARSRVWLAPAALLLVLLAALTAIILFARRAAAPDVPPQPPAFAAPAPARVVSALDVRQVSGDRLILSDSREITLDGGRRIEVLRPEAATGVQPGDWLAVVGVPNEVRNFSIRSLVLITGGNVPDAEGVMRSSAGFAGHEASRDPAERPLLGGVVERVEGETVTLRGPTGPITVQLTAAAPLRRLAAGSPAEVREGDRIAYHPTGNGEPSAASALLVLPGGAR